ncbi:alpha/beta fold hydrolase [Planotetraspora sp. GP83]|uniref:alpha/beta fold hydrolase n=1 Tax=Planotetraspora sp. GP83 TaxID=3156264 RepID=UPI003516149D
MPIARVGALSFSYEIHGTGRPVVLIPPAGTRAAIWSMHQVTALTAAGYQVVTFDARGTSPSSVPPGPYRLADLAADAAGLITELGLGPCAVAGASLGAMTAQELALARPDLVRAAVMLGTRCRTDFFRQSSARAAAARMREPSVGGDFETVAHMTQLFGSATLADDRAAADWFAVLRRFPMRGAGAAAQYEATVFPDRAPALAGITRPCLVVAFGEDVVTPPAMCREVAKAVPYCRYAEISGAGHFGFLEAPDEVNGVLLDFLAEME